MKQLPKDFLTIGRGAEYVIRGEESIILVSAGRTIEVTTRLADKLSVSNVVLRDPSSPVAETIVFSGAAQEAMQAYLDLAHQLTQKKRGSALSILKSLSVSVASIAVVAALSLGYMETRRVAAELTAAETAPALEHQIPGNLPLPTPGVSAEQSALKVLKTPDFLKSADGAAANSAAAAIPAGQQTDQAADTIANIGLPTYNPGLYTAPQDTATVAKPASEKSVEEDATGKQADPSPDGKRPATDQAVKAEPTAKAAPSAKPEEKAEAGDKKPEGPAEPIVEEKNKTANEAAIKKDAEAAVKSLIGNGMTDEDVRKLLMNLQQINAGGDQQITPEMLRALPEEVAALLADQGMELDGPGSGTMNILPSEVVDKFRGKDGVATIPENYSWYARTGGPVSIPLPGGGDIKHPDDFKDFGLQP
ncbi:hypothetical protein OIU34_21115 [Pararhizobium sp. BT-229]|uniref:hypothetical protein n=1 Tax=Pararhizobium sp. BT-229 TaxID=2986923 RepID=UPI0021F6AD37|nr:hypothetical protein [Pararhizobium sp. BT-229]MCV9964392.1 hypothetical protein [Pararhizobium sp. BT-229]